jgi:outer membrane receptor protein involved in Fe transport
MKRLLLRPLAFLMILGALAAVSLAQTAGTGAIAGTVTDPGGAVVAGASISVIDVATGLTRTAVSASTGTYLVPLLKPATYRVEVNKSGFKVSVSPEIPVHVTETATLNIQLQLGTVTETVQVTAAGEALQTETVALGSGVNQQTVEAMPLASRNYTQIIGLSPGVSTEVNNAGNLGRGASSGGAGTGGTSASGGATNDNNYQIDGLEANDQLGSSLSLGVPVPNPDTIQEFKVQTGQYDASYGRNAGANVDLVTKTGSNEFHGTVFEFVRNDPFNANDYFRNQSGEPRPELKQNQFGMTLGGPIKKNKLLFFGSYQGTRQKNGLDTTAACLTTLSSPPFTNDRSQSALGALFTGPSGGAILPDGSNINSISLALLQAKLPNGSYLIPTPQTVDPSLPFASQGTASITVPCTYNEDQFMTNLEYKQSDKSTLAARFFRANSTQIATEPPNQIVQGPSVPGFPLNTDGKFRVLSFTHTYVASPNVVNQASLGFHRIVANSAQQQPLVDFSGQSSAVPLSFSSLGITVPSVENDEPAFLLNGGTYNLGGLGLSTKLFQNYYDFEDSVTYVRGKQVLQFGGGLSRTQINLEPAGFSGTLLFAQDPAWAWFLTGTPEVSIDLVGQTAREWRSWNGDFYAQDNYKASSRLSFQLGLRYEREAALGDRLGRASIVDPSLINPNPPDAGSLQGYVVGSNFSGSLPAGVTRGSNSTAIAGNGQNTWGPRVGFTWQLPGTDRVLLRGGYGIFYSRLAGSFFLQLVTAPPFSQIRQAFFPAYSAPFATIPPSPYFPPYSPTSDLTPTTLQNSLRPPISQQYSMNLQTELTKSLVLQIGYQGERGTHLIEQRSFNQALSASPSDPIRGQTSNTLDNIPLRVPYEGFDSSQSLIIESEGVAWYNALTVSLNKRFSHGLHFLASYTLASALTTDVGSSSQLNGGSAVGNQNDPASRYGRNDFVRPGRFVVSYIYDVPTPHLNRFAKAVLGGWSIAGVTAIQNGQFLTVTDINSLNAFGIYQSYGTGSDRAQLAPGCTKNNVTTPGGVTSKLNNYFKTSCFIAPPVIGADGIATGFGDAATGIAQGPGQNNTDVSFIKHIPLGKDGNVRNVEFRAEFFNAFNHPQFANPNTSAGYVEATPQVVLVPNPNFGQIRSTTVNPRLIQFGLKLNF